MFAGRTFGSDLHLLRIQILDHLFVRGDLIEKDLGIWINRDLKPREQCIQSAKKAQSVLGMVRRHFKEIVKDDFKIIYNTSEHTLSTVSKPGLHICRKTRHA